MSRTPLRREDKKEFGLTKKKKAKNVKKKGKK